MERWCKPAACAAVLALTAGCTQVNSKPDYDRAARAVEDATGLAWRHDAQDDAVVRQRVDELLVNGLTVEEAAELALLNHPRLQAEFLRIGISRAEVVQAGLLSNPFLDFMLRWPDGGGLTNLQVNLAQNIAELWQIPARRRAAERELEQTIFEAARLVSVAALQAKQNYYNALRADKERDLMRENLTITQRLLDLAIARREAGAGSEVDVNLARTQHLQVDLQLRNATLAAVEARAELAKTLGLRIPPGELVLSSALAEPGSLVLTPEQVMESARRKRLDFRAVALSVAAAETRVALEKTRFLRSVELGVSVERSERERRGDRNWLADTAWASAAAGQLAPPSLQPRERLTTDWVVGPSLGVEVPLFDQNQAQIVRAELEYQQAAKALDALDRELTQEAHATLARATTAAQNARFYRDEFLPLQETSLTLARAAYGAGEATLLTVLDAQRSLLTARAGYADALAKAAIAAVELERIGGQPLEQLLQASASQPVEPAPADHD